MMYSEKDLKKLAQNNPKELSRILISPSNNINLLSFGAEILSTEVQDEALVAPVLKMHLKHVHAVVREGAMIGVSAFYGDKLPPQDILDRLKIMAKSDPSPTLKEVAKDLLLGFNK